MLLGPNLLDGSTEHQPLGYTEGEFALQSDGTIHFNSPDSSSLGYTTVQGLEDATDYALIFGLANPNGVTVTASYPGGPTNYDHDGSVVQVFTTVTTGCLLSFTASGDGAGVFGPLELRKVLEP